VIPLDGGERPDNLDGSVTLERVRFCYPARPDVEALTGIDLHIEPGEAVAVVGKSGSGKSTLLNLILRFYDPTEGRVLVGGWDVRLLDPSWLRSHVATVMQEPTLFSRTVAENIAFSHPQATRAEVEAVSRIAHCDEFILGFPQGYDTIVGERGVRLSGGQRQRVAIARAILADPTVLILDEATSSLDSESEALIQDGLRRLRHGRTTFVIAHRLSTIRSADQILVLEHGEIVESGTHEELLARGAEYRKLYELQFRDVEPAEPTEAPARRAAP